METSAKVAFLLAMALALGFIVYTLIGPGGSSKQTRLKTELERIQKENRALAEENHRLALEIEALKKRLDYIEKVAREELGLVRPDEVILNLPQNKSVTPDKKTNVLHKPVSIKDGGGLTIDGHNSSAKP
ncbi:MAG: septum formation initiator family protein [Deltaproteobacteria bacterium]|nr:septum formation initiator family protein [Deltaproteobacteria bacterium]